MIVEASELHVETAERVSAVANHTRRERRQSRRWPEDRPIAWRVHHGHRPRCGRVTERSLHGMVIDTTVRDAAGVGTHLHPIDDDAGLRHGFRDAIVRRSDSTQRGRRLFVEILA